MTHSVLSGFGTRLFPALLASCLVGFGLYFDHAASSEGLPQERVAATDGELEREAASADVRRIAQWAIATQDHAGLPFVVVDPGQARIYAFDPQGHPTGNAAVSIQTDDVPTGRLVADNIATARGGAIVWAKADAHLAVDTDENGTDQPLAPTLRVEPAFWRACLATLRTQPSIAYVLPTTSAALSGNAERKPS
jgi:hypothetical protein